MIILASLDRARLSLTKDSIPSGSKERKNEVGVNGCPMIYGDAETASPALQRQCTAQLPCSSLLTVSARRQERPVLP